jgi:phosphatidylethanolamine/phosphatidyl-N-methylethanolamine N-methyltransferase
LSRLYEPVFHRWFGARIHALIRSLEIPAGAKVLEVGVGTGISLGAYPLHAEVDAIDLSPMMLAQAREKVQRHGWHHIHLVPMDALNLEFADESFDYVTAFHVASVVPDPQRLLREMIRTCKLGGTMAIINHFRSERRWLAALVDLLNPVTLRLGWRTTLGLAELLADVPLEVERRYKTSGRSLFTVLIARKCAAVGSAQERGHEGEKNGGVATTPPRETNRSQSRS